MTTIDYADVMFHRRFQSPDLIITVNPSHDWVEGNYESEHTVWLTVTNSSLVNKGTAHGTTGPVSWWDGQTGFSTNDNVPWDGQQPDITVGDWVSGTLDNGYTTTVHVGEITGNMDVANDRVTGTVTASWFTEPLNARCWIDGVNDSNIEFTVDPNGGTYTCDFPADWLTPGNSVSVQYQEPDGDWVRAVFQEPTPHLRVEKRLESGELGVGGNAVFYVQYVNFGDADAENVFITDTLQGMTYITDTSGFAHTGSDGQIVLDLGTVTPGDWIQFYVFAEVTADGKRPRHQHRRDRHEQSLRSGRGVGEVERVERRGAAQRHATSTSASSRGPATPLRVMTSSSRSAPATTAAPPAAT